MRESRRDSHGHRFRCVVWSPRGRVVDAALLEALCGRPEVDLVFCESMFTAVGAVLGIARREAGVTPVLLLVDPSALGTAADAVGVVRSALPSGSIWVYERRGRSYIRAMREGDEAAWAAPSAGAHREPKVGVSSSLMRSAAGDTAPSAAVRLVDATKWDGRPRLRLAVEELVREGTSENAKRDASCSDPKRETGQTRGTRMTLTDEELSMLLAQRPERGQDSR